MPEADRLNLGDRYWTYAVKRLDRVAGAGGAPHARRMYASAMTLTERYNSQAGSSYLHVVQALEDNGGMGLAEELRKLFRRAVFNLFVGNCDDHLRNHGFLLSPSGWRLAPAFDINPNPVKNHHALTWDGASDASSLKPLLNTAGFYRLDAQDASAIVEEVREVVSGWGELARELDFPKVEVATMTKGFLL